MKKNSYLVTLLAIGLMLFSNGCMMTGLHQMMSHPTAGRSVVSEGGDQRTSVVMEIPPLTAGKESAIQVHQNSRESGMPLSEARVTATIQQHDAEEPRLPVNAKIVLGGLAMGVMMIGMML